MQNTGSGSIFPSEPPIAIQGRQGVDFGISTSGVLGGGGGGLVFNGSYPVKKAYKDDRLWMRDMCLYYIQKVQNSVLYRQAMNQASIDAYTAHTATTKTPQQSGGDPKIASAKMAYEYMNSIFNPINVLMGETVSKSFKVTCEVTNPESRSRYEHAQTEVFAEKLIDDEFPELREAVPSTLPAHVKEVMEYENRIETIMETCYRDVVKVGMERMLEDWMKKERYEEWREQTEKTYILTNSAFSKPYIDPVTWEVKNKYIDPRVCMWDADCNDNYLRDAQFFIHFDWVSLNAALMEFPNLDKEQVVQGMGGASYMNFPVVTRFEDNQDSQYMVLITRMRFLYIEEAEFAIDEDLEIVFKEEYGEMNAEYCGGEKKEKMNLRMQQIYEVSLVGNGIIGMARKYPFQLRSVESPQYAKLGCEGLIFDYCLDQNAPTNMIRILGLQRYRNQLLFKLMELAGQIQGPVISLDVDRILDFEENTVEGNILKTMKYLKDHNFVFETGSKFGAQGASQSALKVTNVSVGQGELNELVTLIDWYEEQIKKTLGVNEARTGGIGKYESTTGAVMNKTQSDYATAAHQIAFENFQERSLQNIANLLKVSLYMQITYAPDKDAIKESMRLRYGDEVLEMCENEDMIFEDIGIRVAKSNVSDAEKMQKLDAAAQQAIAQGGFSIQEYSDLINFENPRDAQKFFTRKIREREKKAEKQQQQAQQAQTEQQQGLLQQQQQGAQQLQQQKTQGDAMLQKQQQMGQMTNEAVKQAMNPALVATQSAIMNSGKRVAEATPLELRN